MSSQIQEDIDETHTAARSMGVGRDMPSTGGTQEGQSSSTGTMTHRCSHCGHSCHGPTQQHTTESYMDKGRVSILHMGGHWFLRPRPSHGNIRGDCSTIHIAKSLELFLKDLCDRTYDITLQRGAKTVRASHLKQCVHRKAQEGDENESDEDDVKRARMGAHHGSGRGRGRRGRGRGSRGGSSGRNGITAEKFEDEDQDLSSKHSEKQEKVSETFTDVNTETRETKVVVNLGSTLVVREFDLNMELDESGVVASMPMQPSVKLEHQPSDVANVHIVVREADEFPSDVPSVEPPIKQEDQYSAWSHSDVDNVAIDSMQFPVLSDRIVDQDEDDYDNEDG